MTSKQNDQFKGKPSLSVSPGPEGIASRIEYLERLKTMGEQLRKMEEANETIDSSLRPVKDWITSLVGHVDAEWERVHRTVDGGDYRTDMDNFCKFLSKRV